MLLIDATSQREAEAGTQQASALRFGAHTQANVWHAESQLDCCWERPRLRCLKLAQRRCCCWQVDPNRMAEVVVDPQARGVQDSQPDEPSIMMQHQEQEASISFSQQVDHVMQKFSRTRCVLFSPLTRFNATHQERNSWLFFSHFQKNK